MDRKFEQDGNGELLGVPGDLITNAAKYDADIPFWKRTVGFLKQYQLASMKNL